MDDDRRELLRRLFVAATELLETAHGAAVAGQSGEIAVEAYADLIERLRMAASDVAALADAAMVLARPGPKNGRDPPRDRPR